MNKINGLTWNPWVGKEYFNIPNEHRLLIVGESHYHDDTPESIKKHKRVTFTQEVIQELAVDREYCNVNMYKNLHLALCGHDEFKADKLWEQIAFYNFIQRPMITNKERPTAEDHIQAWTVFFELLIELKPTQVLFIGVEAANSLKKYDLNIKVEKESPVGKTSPRVANIKVAGVDQPVQLFFIQHTSQYFSHEKWHQYIMSKMGGFVRWLTPIVS